MERINETRDAVPVVAIVTVTVGAETNTPLTLKAQLIALMGLKLRKYNIEFRDFAGGAIAHRGRSLMSKLPC